MGVVSVPCGAIEIQSGQLEPKQLDTSQLTVSIQGREIYVGNSAQWKIKPKDIERLDVSEQYDIEMHVKGSKTLLKYRIFPPSEQSYDERKKWVTFISRLNALYAKHSSTAVQHFSDFLHTSGSKVRSRSNHKTVRHPQPNAPVLTSWDNRHSAATVTKPSRKQSRGVFGSQKAIPLIKPFSAHQNWDEDRHSTPTNNVILPPNVISRGSKSKKQRLLHPTDEQFSSDDDEQYDDRDPRNDQEEVGHELHESPSEPIEEQHHNEIECSDKGHGGTNAKPKRKLTKYKTNLSKYDNKVEQSSDDDELFEPADVTTPLVQRMVSPQALSTATSTRHPRSTISQTKARMSLQNEDNETTEEEMVIDKRQPSIASFFQPLPRPKSLTLHALSTATQDAVKTPTRRTNHVERNERTSLLPVTTILHQTTSSAVKAKQNEDDVKWLRQSPSRKLRSPQESRRLELFGPNQVESSSVNRLRIEKHGVLEDDPIEEYASPSRQHTATKKYQSIERSAYQTFDYSTARKRVAPTLLNRFANSNSTPAALVQRQSDISTYDPTHARSNIMSLHRKFRGLKNLGNTCYQNSSLQMLYSCRNLMTTLKECVERWEQGRSNGTISQSICMIGQKLSRHYMPPVDSRMIKDAMDSKTDKYIGYEQRDAHEFISDLIDFVHDELQANQADAGQSETSGKNDSVKNPFPTDDFCMSVQVCLQCCSCGYTRNKEEMYRHLSIDIITEKGDSDFVSNVEEVEVVPIATVQKSLVHFFRPETREIKCEKCTDGTHAEQTLRIISPPKLLLLHLKRFIVVERMIYPKSTEIDVENQPPNAPSSPTTLSSSPTIQHVPQIEYLFKKNKAPIEIPTSLSLEMLYPNSNLPTVDQTVSGKPFNEYSLQSIVHHIGATASSGHYTADASREVQADETNTEGDNIHAKPERIWVSYDDGITNETTVENIVSNRFKQSTAYMLLYASE